VYGKTIYSVEIDFMNGETPTASVILPGQTVSLYVRRLSTASYGVNDHGGKFVTQWRWYWRDD